jgi:DNA polymerase III delta prime subunit
MEDTFLKNSLIDKKILTQIKKCKEKGFLPNFLFSGPPGTGKTTTAKEIIQSFFPEPMEFLEINSSAERGIDYIRNVVIPFSESSSNLNKYYRIVLFEEGENLTTDAQAALRKTMECESDNCRYIITCNQNTLDPAIKSRCACLPFSIDQKKLKVFCSENKLAYPLSDLRIANRLIENEGGRSKKQLDLITAYINLNNKTTLEDFLKITDELRSFPPSLDEISQTEKVLSDKTISLRIRIDLCKKFEDLYYYTTITRNYYVYIISFINSLDLLKNKYVQASK